MVLTVREKNILELAAGGQSDQQISETLQISKHTVNTHFRNIFKKLEAANRVHAAAKALTMGLIKLNQ